MMFDFVPELNSVVLYSMQMDHQNHLGSFSVTTTIRTNVISGATKLQEGRKEMFYFTTHSTHFYFTVIWRQTYGKGLFR